MKALFTFWLLLLSCVAGFSQDVTAMIKEADRLEAIPDETKAFLKFKDIIKIAPTNVYSLSKCSELCARIGKRQTNKTIREEFYTAAKSFAETALKVDPKSSDANCAMAMALGHISMSKSNKEKINSAKDLKKYVDLAIKADANNYKAWHILGRWHYEISDLSALEKAAVKVLYGGMPPASLKTAITCFEKAKALTGAGFVLNYYELARAYKRNDQKQKAIDTLKAMLNLPNATESDAATKAEGKKLIAAWE
ncbi:tetratricopeptide repeat protein [Ferruginibacter sp. SUN002]|uniref:tetratricopeptide repeat protein n=1 Tax=Ferruginibacter sp. SUN002 TaxID=2937789 RepID=UPI003D36425C